MLNLALSYILIFGMAQIPAMGIKGAAIATAAARYLTAICIFFFALFKSKYIL